jgi:hypothetical protein
MWFHWGFGGWDGRFYDGTVEEDEGRALVRPVVHNRRRRSAGLRIARDAQ